MNRPGQAHQSLFLHLLAYSMGVYERAVFYHFIHALGLLIAPMNGARMLGAVTPLGGLAFILASSLLAVGLSRTAKD